MTQKIAIIIPVLTLLANQSNADLVNGSFESYNPFGYDFYSGSLPTQNWATTAPDNLIEIWNGPIMGVNPYDGTNFAELNANFASALYQDVNGLGDFTPINWHFAHRGRDGTDTMRLTITDLGWDQSEGGDNDIVLFTQEFSTGNSAWQFYSGTITSIGNLTRFSFEAVNAVGGNTQGNFIDDVGFGQYAIPAPATLSMLAVAALVSKKTRRRN